MRFYRRYRPRFASAGAAVIRVALVILAAVFIRRLSTYCDCTCLKNELAHISFAVRSTEPPAVLPFGGRARKRVTPARLLRCSGRASTEVSVLLLLAGDIESNPGPRRPKFPCGICSRAVKDVDPAVCCDQCNLWIHNKCCGLSPHIYEIMKSSSGVWICPSCGLPSFASSLFESSASVSTSNSFVLLSHTDDNQELPVNSSTPIKRTPSKKSSQQSKLKVISINVNSLRGKSIQMLELIETEKSFAKKPNWTPPSHPQRFSLIHSVCFGMTGTWLVGVCASR